MNGQMKKYRDSLKTTPSPVLLSTLPKRVDIRGLMQYAKEKGTKVAELSENEKLSFVKSSSENL